MSILRAYAVPHPPIILPEIGNGEEKAIYRTIESYKRVAREIEEYNPETLIISSPHSVMYRDYFHISQGTGARGDFSSFGHPEVKMEVKYDEEFVSLLSQKTDKAGTLGEKNKELDHGVMVPLYFIREFLPKVKIVRIGLSGYSLWEHYRMGILIQKTAEELNRKVIYIASGDMSHSLKSDGPYSYTKEGPEFDKEACEILKNGDFSKLMEFQEGFLDKAKECGLRSFVMMAGALDGKKVDSEMLSYEGPFGVGYGVFAYKVTGEENSRKFEEVRKKERKSKRSTDSLVELARKTIEDYVIYGKEPEKSEYVPEEMRERAGVFVSLHKEGNLRGCIGTISAVTENISEEIKRNAIEASIYDPRFPKVEADEVEDLDISVDVLGKSEPIKSLDDLDPKKYGVIVTSGFKRGLLLPDLEGVDTIEEQVGIAARKAGIGDGEKIKIERFEVIRHC